jgi:hypothetical protein
MLYLLHDKIPQKEEFARKRAVKVIVDINAITMVLNSRFLSYGVGLRGLLHSDLSLRGELLMAVFLTCDFIFLGRLRTVHQILFSSVDLWSTERIFGVLSVVWFKLKELPHDIKTSGYLKVIHHHFILQEDHIVHLVLSKYIDLIILNLLLLKLRSRLVQFLKEFDKFILHSI